MISLLDPEQLGNGDLAPLLTLVDDDERIFVFGGPIILQQIGLNKTKLNRILRNFMIILMFRT